MMEMFMSSPFKKVLKMLEELHLTLTNLITQVRRVIGISCATQMTIMQELKKIREDLESLKEHGEPIWV